MKTKKQFFVFCSLIPLIAALLLPVSAQSRRTSNPENMTDEELTREVETEKIRAINRGLRRLEIAESRVLGNIKKIDCNKGIKFTVTTDKDTLVLQSKDFGSLMLNAFVPISKSTLVGCDVDMSSIKAVITYKTRESSSGVGIAGDLVSIEFVPADFRIMSKGEMDKSFAFDPSGQITDKGQQEAIVRGIRQALFHPNPGEIRKLGYLDRIECDKGSRIYVLRIVAKTYRLVGETPETMPIRLFTRELEGKQFGCTMQPIDVPVVFIFRERSGVRRDADGELVSLDFVPRGFSLD